MKKYILSIAALAVAAFAADAATLSPAEALGRLQSGAGRHAAMAAGKLTVVHTATTPDGRPAVYVFDRGPRGGYLLVGADDAAYPLLGYADEGEFDATTMPPALRWWLDEYGRQVEYAASAGKSPAEGVQTALLVRARAQRQSIEPMISTHWDQVAPFNDQCPLVGTERTYTGCVATAMAQVMNYWQYPQRGAGSISYTSETIGKKLTMNFDARDFDWANMADDYLPGHYTGPQADAVAYLMKACGYSVKMDYSTDASGALAMYIRRALTHFFNYDGNALYTLRAYHSAAEWESLIYDNLKNVGPVLYGGASNIGGGHSFVCDGYSSDGYFHFNWGWTGMSDGYFALSALNPDALGSGGGQGGGYNFDQDALLGIRPPTGEPVAEQPERITQMGSFTASVDKAGKLSIGLDYQADPMWVNYNATTQNFKLGVRFVPSAAGSKAVVAEAYDRSLRLLPGYGISPSSVKASVDLAGLGLEDGSYTVSTVTIAADDADGAAASDWLDPHTFYGYTTSAILTKKGDSYSIECKQAPRLNILKASIESQLYLGCLQKVSITVENTSDIELTSGFAPLLASAQGELAFMGESICLTVAPGETVTREWITDLYSLNNTTYLGKDTEYALTFLDENTYKVLNQQWLSSVTMKPAASAPTVKLSGTPVVKDAEMSTVDEGSYVANVATITNPYDIEIDIPVRLTKGYFAYNVAACLCEFDPENPGMVVIDTFGAAPLFLEATGSNPLRPDPKEATVTVHISYPLLETGVEYPIICVYIANGSMVPVAGGDALYLAMGAQSAVGDVIAGDTSLTVGYNASTRIAYALSEAAVTEITVADLSGRVLARANGASVDLSGIDSGIVIVSARDAAGNVAGAKVMVGE